jgi:hypothetical protein
VDLTSPPGVQAFDEKPGVDKELEAAFLSNPVHKALAVCADLRPPVDISVSVSGSEGAGSIRPELQAA